VVSAVPESFDGMLEELADAAAAGVALPDVADVRRRARQRTVHRRMTASALAFALLCVSGVAGAAIDGRLRPPGKVSAASAPGVSVAPLGTGSAAGTPTSTPSASAGAGSSYAAAYAGVWAGKPPDSYLVVFPDGVMGLSQGGGFPLCYGQALATSSASPTANPAEDSAANSAASAAGAKTGTILGGSAAGSLPSSTATAPTVDSTSGADTITSKLPFREVGCDGTGVVDGLALQTTSNGKTVELVGPATAKDKAVGISNGYGLAFSIEGAVSGNGQEMMLKELVGQWTSIDGSSQVLNIGVDGSVTYTTVGTATDGTDTGSGEIDAYYSFGARVLTNCTADEQADLRKQGQDFTFKAGQACGLLVVETTSTTDQILVYTGTGQQTFQRVD
jgi:hypothetical protein